MSPLDSSPRHTRKPPPNVTPPTAVHPVLLRPWVAILGGAAAGVVLAALVIVAWSYLGPDPGGAGRAASRPDTEVDVFRSPPGSAESMLVARAGPDAGGEPALAAGLFPGEEPARELASIVVVNRGEVEVFDIDLANTPLRARTDDTEWFELAAVAPAALEALDPNLALRFRGLGGEIDRRSIAPGTLRRFLLALPPGRRFSDVSVVQWGDRTLERGRIDVERLHEFRERSLTPPPSR